MPPNVTVRKNNNNEGWRAVFSKISNLTVTVLSGDCSTFLYRMTDDNNNATNPRPALIKNNCENDTTPTNVKPKDGPNANAKLPDNPKYPIPRFNISWRCIIFTIIFNQRWSWI